MKCMNFCQCDCCSVHYLNVNIKKGDFFFLLRCIRSYHRDVQLCSPMHGCGAVPSPLPAPCPALPTVLWGSPGAAGSNLASLSINRRHAVVLWLAGGTVHSSSHLPERISTAYEWERSGMSAMMATNSLTSEHGHIHLLLLSARALKALSLCMVPHGLGAPAPSPACQEGAPTVRVVDNAGILEPLSSEATEETYYL